MYATYGYSEGYLVKRFESLHNFTIGEFLNGDRFMERLIKSIYFKLDKTAAKFKSLNQYFLMKHTPPLSHDVYGL